MLYNEGKATQAPVPFSSSPAHSWTALSSESSVIYDEKSRAILIDYTFESVTCLHLVESLSRYHSDCLFRADFCALHAASALR